MLKRPGPFDLMSYGAPFATSGQAKKGTELINFRELGLVPPIAGGGQGFNDRGSVITTTIDGVDLNLLWNEFQDVLSIHNQKRQLLIDLLSFPVTQVVEDVAQASGEDFEEASEFGEPKGIRPELPYFTLGFDFKWYDLASRFTFQFLAEADSAQVQAITSMALEADNRLQFKLVMNALFRNTNRSTIIRGRPAPVPVFPLYNADGTVPPDYKGVTFDGTHTHYLVSGAATIDSTDLDDMLNHLRHHGYSEQNGTKFIALMNAAQTQSVRLFKAGVVNNNSAVAQYDFIPATNQPTFFLPGTGLQGPQPSANAVPGFNTIGSYGPLLIVEEEYIPPGYVVVLGSGGVGNLRNPVGVREHANPALRGLQLRGGNRQADYPLVDSFYIHGLGTGVRQRGGAVIMQIKASGSYAIPTNYA